jgi:hypothetical protein
MTAIRFFLCAPWLLLGAALLPGAAGAVAQTAVPWSADELLQQPRVPFKLYSFDSKDSVTPSRTARLQMVGMQSGFITNPLGVDPDDDPAPEALDPNGRPPDGDPDYLQLAVGTYNPYFDLRLPGDPGARGYYKVHSQVQLLDAKSTSFCLNLQAYTPAGQEVGGIANGPTYLVPGLAGFHDLGRGIALQGYFGQNIQANSRWSDRMGYGFHYGMAVQCPVPLTGSTGDQGLFLFFEALGRYRPDTGQPGNNATMWEFVPGVQVRVNSSCWMSLGASRYNFLTCSWRY